MRKKKPVISNTVRLICFNSTVSYICLTPLFHRYPICGPPLYFLNSSLLWDVFIINSVKQLQTLPKTQSEIDISPFLKTQKLLILYSIIFLLASTQGVSCRLVMNHLIYVYVLSHLPPPPPPPPSYICE